MVVYRMEALLSYEAGKFFGLEQFLFFLQLPLILAVIIAQFKPPEVIQCQASQSHQLGIATQY